MRFKIYRIVDVNLNRATEGLRVVEEICRFVLEDKILTAEVKGLRAELSKVSRKLKARRSLEDVGRKLYPESESKRVGVEDIFRANMKRAQEALRCLEEFSKLIDPELGRKFKRIRFKLYDLEKRIAHHLKFDFDLYVITDPMRDHIKTAREAVAGGAKIVQLREKTASKKQILKWAKKMRKLVPIFIINDYADIAKKVGADGIHLGQEDLKKDSVAQTRKRLGEDKIIGVSTHSFSQAVKAEKMGADYISVGPIFSTPSKPGIKPLGLKLLRRVLKRVKIPVVAIGGIKESNIYDVRKTGCKRVAVIRAVLEKKYIKKAVSRLRRMFSC
jgi:thiamine-phosphate pyrophosphorylase